MEQDKFIVGSNHDLTQPGIYRLGIRQGRMNLDATLSKLRQR